MSNWEFEHSIYTIANRMVAWSYWSNIGNHAKMEPGIKKIELDGPFETGTTGRTITEDYTQEWKLNNVIEGKQFTIIGYTPDGEGSLSFSWTFEDEGQGTRMTQRIKATGSTAEDYPEEFRQMEEGAPKGMAKLAEELDRLAEEK